MTPGTAANPANGSLMGPFQRHRRGPFAITSSVRTLSDELKRPQSIKLQLQLPPQFVDC